MGLYDREIQKQKRERVEKVSKARERQDLAKMEKMREKYSISQENTKAVLPEATANQMQRFRHLTDPPNNNSQIFRKTIDDLLVASGYTSPSYDGNVTDFSSWVYSLYQKRLTPAELAQHAKMEVDVDKQRMIANREKNRVKRLQDKRSTLSEATPGWKLKYKHFAKDDSFPLKISNLQSRGLDFFGKPDLVFRNRKGEILIVEIKVTSASVPKNGWPNIGAQLWAYANADIFKQAPKILLAAEVWGLQAFSEGKPEYISYDFYDSDFQESNRRLFERYVKRLA